MLGLTKIEPEYALVPVLNVFFVPALDAFLFTFTEMVAILHSLPYLLTGLTGFVFL